MNNKGFAITTVIYSMVILLSLVMILILNVLRSNYNIEKDYTSDINSYLNECLKEGRC